MSGLCKLRCLPSGMHATQSHSQAVLADPVCSSLAGALTQMQYLNPHGACAAALTKAAAKTGLCAQPAARVLRRLEITPTMAVGRLSRSQLLQLANTFYRYARRLPAPELVSRNCDA